MIGATEGILRPSVTALRGGAPLFDLVWWLGLPDLPIKDDG
ncbi:MAG: hypothetical protein ACR2NX_09585 [Chthoniobacterales bacterium]